MKIEIQIDENVQEDEIIIKCKELNDEIKEIQNMLNDKIKEKVQISYYKDNTEYYIPLTDILFFQTEAAGVTAHTKSDMYDVKYKLYELENILPQNFMRISKSAILNINKIYSITHNLTSSSIIEFQNTYKKVYVSRHYYKELKLRLLEKRR